MKHLLLVCTDGTVETIPEGTDVQGWAEEMTRRGIRVTGLRLRPPSDPATVRAGIVGSMRGPAASGGADWPLPAAWRGG